MNFVHSSRIPQQGRSFVLFCFFIFLLFGQNLHKFKGLSLQFMNTQTKNCEPIQCTVWLRNDQNR